MADASEQLRLDVEAVSRTLKAMDKQLLEAEGPYLRGQGGLALLDRHINEFGRVWPRALSTRVADLDEALARESVITLGEASASAAHVRALVIRARRAARRRVFKPVSAAASTERGARQCLRGIDAADRRSAARAF